MNNKHHIIMNPIFKKSNNWSSTSYHFGVVWGSADEIAKVLGEPYEVMDDKTNYQWSLELEDGTYFTLYDYRSWGVNRRVNLAYHIGTDTPETTEKVVKALKAAGLDAYIYE